MKRNKRNNINSTNNNNNSATNTSRSNIKFDNNWKYIWNSRSKCGRI